LWQHGQVSWLELRTYSPRLPILRRSGSGQWLLRAAFVAPTVAGQQGNSSPLNFAHPILDFGLLILD